MTLTPKEQQEFEEILKKHFDEGMLGVKMHMTNFDNFKKAYPSLLKVIYKSMREVATDGK